MSAVLEALMCSVAGMVGIFAVVGVIIIERARKEITFWQILIDLTLLLVVVEFTPFLT